MQRRTSLALAALALGTLALGGCTSPETLDDPMATGFFAAGLTYASGDAKAGTVTVASLPLLSYYHFKEDPTTKDRSVRLCWLPLIASFDSEQHNIREVVRHLKAPPGCPDDDEPAPPPAPKRGRIVIRTTDDEDAPPPRPAPRLAPRPVSAATTSSDPLAPPRVEEAPAPPPRPAPSTAPAPRSVPAPPPRTETAAPNGAKILRSDPATNTTVDVLFPFFHVERERPGVAIIQRPGRAKSLVEVGDSTDRVRALPLFSYTRVPERESLILWPLLASGFDNDASGKHLVLFYFLKIRTGDPDKDQ